MSDQQTFPGFEDYVRKPRISTPANGNGRKSGDRRQFSPLPVMFSLSPDYFVVYNDTSEIRAYKKAVGNDRPELVRKLNPGTLSRGGRSRMKRACNYLYMIGHEKKIYNPKDNYWFNSRLSVITLTLSQKQFHTDSEIKNRLYKNFIDALRKRYPALSYVWRAETQSNGNLHFHIITDHFVPAFYINGLWNGIQERYGYLDKYKREKWRENIAKGKPITDAPSVEIRKVKSEKCMARYMRKYMTKGLQENSVDELKEKIRLKVCEGLDCNTPSKMHGIQVDLDKLHRALKEAQKRKVNGKLWGCSDNLLLRPYINHYEGLSAESFSTFESCEIIKPASNEYFTVFKIDSISDLIDRLGNDIAPDLRKHFAKLYPPKILPSMQYRTDKNYTY